MGLNKAGSIKQMLDALKSEKYALCNSELVMLDEYIKNLYVKLLCTVVQYNDDPEEGQMAYLKRVISGIEIDDSLEVCMRKALEISETDVQEFLSIVEKEKYKYYFILDGIVLLTLGKRNEESYEYFAELIELLGINKMDLNYICAVAKAVLEQSSLQFDNAAEWLNERVENLDFTPYIRNFYAGTIINSESEKHYFASDKEISRNITYLTNYSERRVVFENVIIEVNDDWKFNGCEEIIFSNCTLLGTNKSLRFDRVGSVKFSNCKVENFSNGVAFLDSINKLEVSFSRFINCGRTGSGDFRGGMFVIDGDNQSEEVIIESSEFHNCYIAADTYRYNYGVTGVVLVFESQCSKKIKIVNNKFTGCECKNNEYYTAAYISHPWREYEDIEESGNTYTGDLQRLFEK